MSATPTRRRAAPPQLDFGQALEAARRLAPALAGRAAAAEALRRLPEETIEDLHRTGLLRLGQPRRRGGSELPYTQYVQISAALARGCASTAWVWANYACHHWMLCWWPKACQDEIWDDDPDALIASTVVFPAGKATRVEGGFRLSGRWPFSSGIAHAAWDMLGGIVQDTGEYRIFLVPAADYEVIDNWDAMGLRATSSSDVVVKDAFVPERRAAPLDWMRGGRHPALEHNPAPVNRVAIFAGFPFLLSGIPLGAAEGAYDAFVAGLRGRVTKYSGKSVADFSSVQIKIAEAAMCLDTARLLMERAGDEVQGWAERDAEPDLATKVRWRRDGAFSTQLCVRAIDALYAAGGGGALYKSSPLERAFRDVHAAASHISMSFDVAGTTYGRVVLGLPSDNPTL